MLFNFLGYNWIIVKKLRKRSSFKKLIKVIKNKSKAEKKMAEKVKKSIPWFLVLILIGFVIGVGLNFGKSAPPIAEATDIATTTVTVGNATPTWEVVYEDPASTTTDPTNEGSNVTIRARANDPNDDDWWLIICKAEGYSTTSDGSCPSCTNETWATSSATTTDNTTTTLNISTSGLTGESYAWYAYACDDVGSDDQLCSEVSQGYNAPTTDANSPFNINHRPNFTTITDGASADPGGSINVTTTASDDDSEGGSDTVDLYICDGADTTPDTPGCTGASQLCATTSKASAPSCSFSIDDPKADDTYHYRGYVYDNHSFAASGAPHDTEKDYTVNNVSPIVSGVTLNNGSDIDLITGGEGPSGSLDVTASSTVVDHNGCTDVSTVTVKAYPTDLGVGNCTSSNSNYCYYQISCTGGGCAGNGYAENYTCTINFKYHADPTDSVTPRGGGDGTSAYWKDTVTAQDEALSTSTEMTGTGVDVISYLSLDVTTPIAYGSLSPGEISNTTNLPKTATTSTTGNTGLDIELSGTQMCDNYPTCSGNTIATSSQRFATSSVQYQNATALTGTPDELELNCPKTTITASPEEKANWWGFQVPLETPTGSYTGENTYGAVKAETGDW